MDGRIPTKRRDYNFGSSLFITIGLFPADFVPMHCSSVLALVLGYSLTVACGLWMKTMARAGLEREAIFLPILAWCVRHWVSTGVIPGLWVATALLMIGFISFSRYKRGPETSL